MYRILLLIIGIVFLSCNPKKKEDVEKKLSNSDTITGITEIKFIEDVHDLGTLVSGEIVVYSFEFTNTGNKDLNIEKVETDCGCIQVNFPKMPVKPGVKDIIEIEFDSSGMFGKQLKSIEIHANTKELKHLVIFATVKNEQLEITY